MNVHEEAGRLAQLGVIYFEENGRSKRPIVCRRTRDQPLIQVEADDAAIAAP